MGEQGGIMLYIYITFIWKAMCLYLIYVQLIQFLILIVLYQNQSIAV